MDKKIETRSVHDFIKEHQEAWDAMSPEEQEAKRAANLAANEAYEKQYEGMTFEEIESLEMAKALGKPGWTYRDLPRMTPELMEKFQEVAGDENLHWITFAQYTKNTEDGINSVRGQVLISPEGVINLSTYAKESKDG